MHRFLFSTVAATLVTTTVVFPKTTLRYSASADAATIPTVFPSTEQDDGHLSPASNAVPMLSSRLSRYRFRFGVRPSAFRRGGFRRGESCPNNQEITALTPFMDGDGDRLGDTAPAYLSASHHPTFFIYVPDLPATNGILTIQNQNEVMTERYFYSIAFNLTGESGIVGIQLPEDAPPLEPGVEYVWQVSVACVPGATRNSLTVHGGVVDVIDVTVAPGDDALETYLDAEVWQETLTILAQERYSSSNGTGVGEAGIEADWRLLLDAAGLSAFADEPIIQWID